MTKRLFSIFSLLCLVLGSHAEAKYMTIEMKTGTTISFLLADNPVITYNNESLVVNNDIKTTYSFEDVKNYHFTESFATGVNALPTNELRIVWIDDETIGVQNAQPNSIIAITAVSGVVVSQTRTATDGISTVRMPSKAGVYVLSVDKQSFKITRKH